jgi:hypothetical protein
MSQIGITYAEVCQLAVKLPGVEKSTSYGTPALKVRGQLMVRLKEDHETIVLKTTFEDRGRLLAAQPEVFYLTDHYVSYSWILVRLPLIDRDFLSELITEAWRLAAPPSTCCGSVAQTYHKNISHAEAQRRRK